jgi:hypothetical protein
MRRSRVRFPERCVRRWLVVGLVVAGYVASAAGVPLPAPSLPRNGERFPCENHRCGCSSAQQCRDSCCCYSRDQKLAWARDNGVPLPVAADSWHATRQRDVAHDHRACAGCCPGERVASPPEPQLPEGSDQPTSVVGLAARHCQGLGTNWLSAMPALPPAEPVACGSAPVPTSWMPLTHQTTATLRLAPPIPPPRLPADL